jgi:tetratricopeptide (TPR) repeat protein
MKKLLPLFVLVCTTIAFTQNSNQPTNTSTPAPGSKNTAIQDTTEFKGWEDARNIADPAGRAKALEAFLVSYPNTVAKLPALIEILKAYQQAGDNEKLQPTAKRILEIEPSNITALGVDVIVNFMNSQGPKGNPAAVVAAGAEAQKALKALDSWQKPDDMTQDDYDKQRRAMTLAFSTAAGVGALESKDYAAARTNYQKLFDLDPSIDNCRTLGFADLQMDPPDVAGFWYLAKALSQAQAQNNKAGAQQLAADAKDRYRRYHGGMEGWDQIVVASATQATLPAGFTVKPKPTECEQVVAQVQSAKIASLGVGDWEIILSHRDCSPDAKPLAEKIWQAIQDQQKSNGVGKLAFPAVKVISATTDTVKAAITDDNQQANKIDLQFTMEKPFATPPAVGAQLDVVGVVADYTPSPFMFIMQSAEAQAAKPAALKKPTKPMKQGGKKQAAKPRAKVKSALR